MKRILGCMVALCSSALVLAQAPFTIVRPADGSKVREAVHILFPKNSIPDGGYIGIFINGKFIEATIPDQGQKFLDYTLDTKAMKLPDGPTTVEAVLYQDFQEKPRILDRSSIQVNIANSASIDVPDAGLKLRYKFIPGTEWIYKWDTRIAFSTISEAQANNGGRAAVLPIDSQSMQLVYAVDNAYGDGDGLLRIQGLPPKGKTSLMLQLAGDAQPRRYFDYQMYPVYMRVHNTGMEVFGALPALFPFFSQGGGYSSTDLVADFPLPTLPVKSVRPGDTWQTRFQVGTSDLGSINSNDSISEKVPARGEFVGIEWEMGHPCAKIHHSFSVGMGLAGTAERISTNAQAIDETFWFALDKGAVIKMIRTTVIDRRMEGVPAAPGPTASNTGGSFGQGGGSGVPPGSPVKPQSTGTTSSTIDQHLPSVGLNQRPRGRPGLAGPPRGGAPGGSMFGGPPPPGVQIPGMTGRNGNAPSNNAAPTGQLFRVTFEEIYTLEK